MLPTRQHAASKPADVLAPVILDGLSRSGFAPDNSRSPSQPPSATASDAAPQSHGHDFSRIHVSPAEPMVPQARLVLGQPGDRFEREADAVADIVMRSSAVDSERPQATSVSGGDESLRRAADESAEAAPAPQADAMQPEAQKDDTQGTPEQVAAMLLAPDEEAGANEAQSPAPAAPAAGGRDEPMQARELPGQTPTVSSNQEAKIGALRGGGQPLPSASRAFFEPRFGQDLSHVRVHTGAAAGRLARDVQAKAFTVGRDVVFGEGHYQPASPTGQWLMAHELTHVLQQQAGLARSPAAGIQVQPTGQPQVQGGFFGDVWSGIKKGASAAWSGIKKGASATWSGIKKGASAAWSGIKTAASATWIGIKAVSKWGWNVLKSGASLAWSAVVNFPGRVWQLIKHLGSGVAGVASWLWDGLKLAWHLDFKGLGNWLLDGVLSGAAWVGRLIGKLVDVAGIGEV